jgi:CheY-like chemotaxis protein
MNSKPLSDEGALARAAGCVAEALAALQQHGPVDAILSDISLPGEDGYSFIRKVRQLQGPAARAPAIALTALARSEDRRRALLAGFQTHVAKPVDPAELVAVIASLTGRTGQGAEPPEG